ncbi:MAG: PTS fructose transporter subunit IIC [Phycisphaerales bacterium]|nr:PTS fructose transporter subunit IIC [Phycisphaerales bacterium]
MAAVVDELKKLRQHLLTGVSFAIPFIACGGILIALSLAFAPKIDGMPLDQSLQMLEPEWARNILLTTLMIGGTAFTLMLPVLGGYIAYSIAGKPGLVAGMLGGWLSGNLTIPWDQAAEKVSAGFLGAIVAGIIAGYVVQALKKIPANKFVKPIMPILIIPVLSALAVGGLMLLVIGPPIAGLMTWMTDGLEGMQTGSAVLLAAVLGAMIAFDMGGPVNKVAFFFAAGLIQDGNIMVMGPVAAAICTPPLGLGLATIVARGLWREEQREAGLAAVGMGMIGITEGAIPFAASDPLRVIPCIMLGSMAASVTAMLGSVGNNAPHGGPIVLFVVENKLMYTVAIAVGTAVTAAAVIAVKKLTQRQSDKTAE